MIPPAALISSTATGAITSIQAVYVPADDLTDPSASHTFAHLSSNIVLSRARVAQGLYPAVDPLASGSNMLTPVMVGDRHYRVATAVRRTLAEYEELKDIIVNNDIDTIKNIGNSHKIAILDTSSISFMQRLDENRIIPDKILSDYDLILTGDLGKYGKELFIDYDIDILNDNEESIKNNNKLNEHLKKEWLKDHPEYAAAKKAEG